MSVFAHCNPLVRPCIIRINLHQKAQHQPFLHHHCSFICIKLHTCVCRSGKLLGWSVAQKSWTHDVFFGWNMVCKATGVVSVGDDVTVLQPQLPMDQLVPA